MNNKTDDYGVRNDTVTAHTHYKIHEKESVHSYLLTCFEDWIMKMPTTRCFKYLLSAQQLDVNIIENILNSYQALRAERYFER